LKKRNRPKRKRKRRSSLQFNLTVNQTRFPMGPGLFLAVVNSAHQVSSNYASIRGFYDYSKEHNMNFLSPRGERTKVRGEKAVILPPSPPRGWRGDF
jgi:hypothetical protein